ncbi:MAG: DNA-processing protein DprA [Gemmataceae bacterium]
MRRAHPAGAATLLFICTWRPVSRRQGRGLEDRVAALLLHGGVGLAAGRGLAIRAKVQLTLDAGPAARHVPSSQPHHQRLSRAVIVVEANARSGALITARHAAEQGREVYAVPGRVDDPASAGCLELIRGGARLVCSADDVIEDLKGISAVDYSAMESGRRQPTVPRPAREQTADIGRPTEPAPALAATLDPIQQRVFDAVATRKHADELTRELGLSVADLTRTLMQLEMKKLVRRQPGNFYERR